MSPIAQVHDVNITISPFCCNNPSPNSPERELPQWHVQGVALQKFQEKQRARQTHESILLDKAESPRVRELPKPIILEEAKELLEEAKERPLEETAKKIYKKSCCVIM